MGKRMVDKKIKILMHLLPRKNKELVKRVEEIKQGKVKILCRKEVLRGIL